MFAAFTLEKDLPFRLKGMIRHEQTLNVRQNTELSITPRLQQAIALLRLSTAELNQYVDQQLLENPLLMQADDISLPGDTIDDDYDDGAVNDMFSHRVVDGADQISMWNAKETLYDYLNAQIHVSFHDEIDRLIAAELMLHLDEDGFLDHEWVDVSSFLGVSTVDVERVLAVLRTFDPPGLFARSVAETLTLQLNEKGIMGTEMASSMLEAFQKLQYHGIEDVAKQAKITLATFQDFLGHLRHLQFRPSHSFNQPNVLSNVVPDVRIVQQLDGEFAVVLSITNLSRVLVNSQYYHDVKGKIKRAEELSYLKEKFASANWLIQSLQKRAATLLQVSSEIVYWQRDFFASQRNPLKPMTLRDIADRSGVHESTVSRITTAKYIQTPRGLFELKSLFVSSVGNKNNETHTSSNEIQNALKQIIHDEPKNKPLSDEDLVGILQSNGVTVARRTVAKYRTFLGIPSSGERKRHNAMRMSLKKMTC